ncbi:sulfotransferase family protein [Parvularcula lutaonensis]|uniref:Sulfotransferase family protein n=1 Tax=Parvularcula lutaonensis TaxID=491923 RepID=A0ABV7M9S5_9PROT|nr:sulfotransferase [Parvularcula lutaonensis]GGY46105.1 sulfotransferase [Parvularcula lutaonensis]
MKRPDYVIIGGMKCGTSTLAAQLGAQDGIFMTEPKEPNFFSDEETFAKGLEWYSDLFESAKDGDLLGEASTHYAKWPVHPKAAERLRAYAPEAKLIYMVRDPVKRALSQLRHHWTMREVEGHDLEAIARSHAPLWHYSRYETQLQKWLEHYPGDQVLVVSLERLEADPYGEFRRVLSFLGASGEWAEHTGDQNVGADRSRRLPLHGLLVESPVATFLRRALVPKRLRTWVRERRQMPRLELSDDAKAFLADQVREDIAAFGARFGMTDLSPENFRERMLSRQLSGGGTADR